MRCASHFAVVSASMRQPIHLTCGRVPPQLGRQSLSIVEPGNESVVIFRASKMLWDVAPTSALFNSAMADTVLASSAVYQLLACRLYTAGWLA